MKLFDVLSRDQVALLHAVKPQTVSRWVAAGMPRNADGTFCGPATIAWRLRPRTCPTCGFRMHGGAT